MTTLAEVVEVRPARQDEWTTIWPLFRLIVEAGGSYPYPSGMPEAEARRTWMEAPMATYVAECAGRVVGSYYLKPNQMGRGVHVYNCGYMVARTLATAG